MSLFVKAFNKYDLGIPLGGAFSNCSVSGCHINYEKITRNPEKANVILLNWASLLVLETWFSDKLQIQQWLMKLLFISARANMSTGSLTQNVYKSHQTKSDQDDGI